MSRPYCPSNATEGDSFMEDCGRDRAAREGRPEDGCEIIARAMAFGIGDPGYPSEWVMDDHGYPGNPRCTAFVAEGPVPDPPDPNQLNLFGGPTDGR